MSNYLKIGEFSRLMLRKKMNGIFCQLFGDFEIISYLCAANLYTMERLIDYNEMSNIEELTTMFSQVKDSYMFFRLTGKAHASIPSREPVKFNGSMLMLVRAGSPFRIRVNDQVYTLKPNTLLTVHRGDVVSSYKGDVMTAQDDMPADFEAYVIFFNLSFLRSVNINITALNLPQLFQKPQSTLDLAADESDTLMQYFELLHNSAADNPGDQLSRCIASSIISAMIYQMVRFFQRRLSQIMDCNEKEMDAAARRRHEYVRNFLKLVHVHFAREHSVNFYARQLYISPKYLTQMVREATGKTAARWIDDFLIMEAKNMLRYSGKNIQQVAYALNFATQSSFGKYFKHITGISPSEYQRT